MKISDLKSGKRNKKVDLGKRLSKRFERTVIIEYGTAPTDGAEVEIYKDIIKLKRHNPGISVSSPISGSKP